MAGTVPTPRWGKVSGSSWCPACWRATRARRCAARWTGRAAPERRGRTETRRCGYTQKQTIQSSQRSHDTEISITCNTFSHEPTVRAFRNKKISQNATGCMLTPCFSTYCIIAGETLFMVSSLHTVKYLHPPHSYTLFSAKLSTFSQCTLISTSYYLLHTKQKATSQSSLLFFSVSNSLLWQQQQLYF